MYWLAFKAIVAMLATAAASVCSAGQLYLYKSESTKQYLAAAQGDYLRLTEPWRAFAMRSGITLKEAGPEGLGSLAGNDVLIMPSVLVLSTAEKEAINRFAKKGGSVLASWASGGRDAAGQWVGYSWLQTMFGVEIVADIRGESRERFLLPFGETMVSSQLAAGKRIYLAKTGEPLLRAKARYPVARFGEWQRTSHLPHSGAAAIAVDEIQGSRRAWLGFAENTWETATVDMDLLLKDLLQWLQRKPVVGIAAWPSPYQSAFFIEMDTEDKFENAATLEKLFDDRGMRGTFYLLTSLAQKQPDLVRRLAKNHEVGYHAEVHDGFKGQSVEVQEGRMARMQSDLKGILGDITLVRGFRAPLESYDINTEKALRKFGIRHHAADPGSQESALPGFSSTEPNLSMDEALVVIPRTLLDDINYLQMGLLAPGSVRTILLENLRDKLTMRGLGLLSVHTQNFSSGSVLDKDLPVLMDEVQRLRDRVWSVSGDQIERWWRARARINIAAEWAEKNASSGTLKIRVDNRGLQEVRNIQLIVTAPTIASQPRLLAGSLSGASVLRQDDFRWSVSLPLLPAASRSQIVVGF